jgi:hypothetical protein
MRFAFELGASKMGGGSSWADVTKLAQGGRLKEKAEGESDKKQAATAEKIGRRLWAFVDEIAALKVLDPACGSANFLYVVVLFAYG